MKRLTALPKPIITDRQQSHSPDETEVSIIMTPEINDKITISVMTPKEKEERQVPPPPQVIQKPENSVKLGIKQTHVIPDATAFQKNESMSTIDYQLHSFSNQTQYN